MIVAGIGALGPPCAAAGEFRHSQSAVDERLRHVLDDREAAGEVAVEGGVADRHLRLVAGGEHEPAELVGERHQQVAADARLQVLLG